MAEPSIAEQKLTQYLNEAYGLEQRLETSLQAHIAMATYAPYKKRLREHLTETRRHAREVGKRIKQLGGEAATLDLPGPSAVGEAAEAIVGGAQKAVALAQGPLHAIRGTGPAEKQLKNAKSEYADESEEIATYSAIEALADAIADRDTVKLARAIRREEERMRSYLEREIPRFTRAVATAEIPASQRRRPAARSRAKATSRRKPATGSTKAASRTRAAVGSKPAARAKATASRAKRTARSASR